jgi:ornithine cyclodeaminase/alanine dehydrogenase
MKIEKGRELLYLTRADVVGCAVSPADANAAIEAGFVAKSAGRAQSRGAQMPLAGGVIFDAKVGVLGPHAAVKWYGYVPDNGAHGLPNFTPVIVLSDTETGLPVAVMDGTWITEIRTASITAVAAKYLARTESCRVGFVACGAQARSHLEALRVDFDLRNVVAYSRRRETAEAFVELASGRGLEARSVTDPRDAIADVDIVVSSVPIRPSRGEFLDASWTSPGTFVSMVDVGFSWRRETLRAFDRVVTEDVDHGIGSRGLHFGKPIESDLPHIVSASDKGATPRSSAERVAFVFAGTGLGDVVLASLVFGRALERGIGRILPL